MKDGYPMYWDKNNGAVWRKVWCYGNDGSGSGLDADLLDGNQGSWYQSNALKFKLVKSAAVDAPVDLNTDIAGGGIVGNTNSGSSWRNAPNGFSLGAVIEFERTTNQNWAGQLAFDSKNSDTAPTKSLWWRSSWGDGFKNDWHQIAFTDSNVASADKLTENVLTNENLNTIKPDFFTNYIAQASNTCANKPSGVTGFNLTAYKTSNNFYIQILSSVIDGDYRRTCTNNAWSAWRKLSYEPNTISLKTTLETLVSTVETSGLYQLVLDEDSLITEGLKKSVVGDKVIFTDYATNSDNKLIFTIDNKKTINGYDQYVIKGSIESTNGLFPIEGIMVIHGTQVAINLCSPLIIAWHI